MIHSTNITKWPRRSDSLLSVGEVWPSTKGNLISSDCTFCKMNQTFKFSTEFSTVWQPIVPYLVKYFSVFTICVGHLVRERPFNLGAFKNPPNFEPVFLVSKLGLYICVLQNGFGKGIFKWVVREQWRTLC